MAHTHDTGTGINRNFKIALALNVAIVALQATYGFLSHSVALIADAGHNLTDVLSLVFALGANMLAARPPTKMRTYGYRRTTILAALLNAVLLLVTTGAILYGAIERLRDPVPVDGGIVSIVAGISIVLNGLSAILFARGRHDLNVRAAFLHMAGDAGVSAGVVVAGLVIVWTGALWVDPIMSMIISVVILLGTWKILRESFNLAADAVPEQIDPVVIEAYLRSVEGVRDIHDLHIWGMSTTHVVLTAHLVIPERTVEDSLLFDISHELQDRYGIDHATLQVERGSLACELEASHVI
ncbi:MAG: cation diffusion facilitator family transporter [Bacteroidota bacterium]|nr:cation diffusion facilitator family transporter [Bacteroidota bacterium]MDP4234644.1 cation diffusion facilitator family transporter [Bacteroidota bacterium]MDP4243809.1 cation diffusion facilitator family transporter [Bacteroidota bacterium]MDP4288600.1 cation diffusion facilitator family transporter [Bacteroidota bacterium]